MEQIHKIFKLCGSPSDEYWQKLEVPQTGMFKPHRQYRRRIAENFKDFPHSALVLLDNLLALEPEARGTAASILQSDVSLVHLPILVNGVLIFYSFRPLTCKTSESPIYHDPN